MATATIAIRFRLHASYQGADRMVSSELLERKASAEIAERNVSVEEII